MPFHQYRFYICAEEIGLESAAALVDDKVEGGDALEEAGFEGGGGEGVGTVGYEEGVFCAGDGVAVDVVGGGGGIFNF